MKKLVVVSFGLLFMTSCILIEEEVPENDLEPPVISIISPTTHFSYLSNEDRITISGIANDNIGISKIEWKNTQGLTATASGTSEWTVENIQLNYGDNIFTFIAYDGANNKDSLELVVTYNEFISFLDAPLINPSGFFINTNTDVTIKISLLKNANLIDNSIKLIEVDKRGNEIREICELFDDGDLSHSDDIKGDGVYCNNQTFNKAISTKIYLRVKASSLEANKNVNAYSEICTISIIEKIPETLAQEIIDIQEGADSELQEYRTYLSRQEAIEHTIEYLLEQNYVNEVSVTKSGDIWIVYEYDLEGNIITSEEGNEGGLSDDPVRKKTVQIPINLQTRGTIVSNPLKSTKSNINKVLNNSVLLYAPNYEEFHSWGTEFLDNVNNIIEESECPNFNIDYLKNDDADLSVLRNLSQYGLIIIHTHGGLDKNNHVIFRSGEEHSTTSTDVLDWELGRLYISTHKGTSSWGVKPSYIDAYNDKFPNSIIYNGSCESGHNKTLANIFLNKGANTYYGFSETVKSWFDRDMANQLFPELITQNKTTGEAFVAEQHDTNNPPAYFVIFGNTETYFSAEFVNGDFEEGALIGWDTDGDGRVITQLGFISPFSGNFMGIISTGLGYTIKTGELSQNICLPETASSLNLRWNILSEEFLEYVGSIYQDYFEIAIVDENGNEHLIFHKTIDDIYNEYNLIEVSPEIVFDQGDVYYTDWQFFSYNISQFAGTNVTLIIRAGDIGDSIYDTAILLDEIEIN